MRTNRRYEIVALAIACVALGGCEKKQVVKGPIPPGEYEVLDGDDLSNIALRAYGDMNLWSALLNANQDLKSRPRFRLEIGETVNIPEKAKLDRKLPKSVFPKELPADYIVMPGDSLHFIAQGCYGNRELWQLIYEANRNKLSENVKEDTRRLVAGEVLRIPAKEEWEANRQGDKEKGRQGEAKSSGAGAK